MCGVEYGLLRRGAKGWVRRSERFCPDCGRWVFGPPLPEREVLWWTDAFCDWRFNRWAGWLRGLEGRLELEGRV